VGLSIMARWYLNPASAPFPNGIGSPTIPARPGHHALEPARDFLEPSFHDFAETLKSSGLDLTRSCGHARLSIGVAVRLAVINKRVSRWEETADGQQQALGRYLGHRAGAE